MQLLRLVESKVKIGVPLPWNVRLSDGSLLLGRGYILQNQRQLDMLMERGAFVDPEEVKAHFRESVAANGDTPMPARQMNLFVLWEKAIRRLEDMLKGFPSEPDFPAQVETLARDILEMVGRDTDIAIYLALRQEKVSYSIYGYAHAVHTSLICILMARRMQWTDSQILTLTKAALTMNVSIISLQGHLAGQDGPIRKSQKDEINLHPSNSFDMLMQAGVTDAEWLTAVVQHHEHPGGKGYPQGLVEVSIMAQALRYADIFMAKISRRATRKSLTAQDAARQLLREDNGGQMAMAIIKEFGIYPPGDFVKLNSGELAVVIKRSDNAKTPMVACITDASGKPIVSTSRRDTSMPEFAITGAVADKSMALRVPPERLYGFSLVSG